MAVSNLFRLQGRITVGNDDSGNCYPFSCGAYDGLAEYQEVYMASAFPRPLSFSSVSFGQNSPGLMRLCDLYRVILPDFGHCNHAFQRSEFE